MSGRARITDPQLVQSYLTCQRLSARHGRTYYLAAALMPPRKRPFIHALYGFARSTDEIVDGPVGDAAAQLAAWRRETLIELRAGRSNHPIRCAFVDTVRRWDIAVEHVEAFLDSMAMDLTTSRYETYDDLHRYMYGSAASIGLQLLPILEPATPAAAGYAQALGIAFQLANFIRDVGEDLDRGRIYLPLEDLDRFGVSPAELADRKVTPGIRAALQFQIARVRRLDRFCRPGVAMLHPATRDCVDTARILYCGIVDAVQGIDFDVFSRRASVSAQRRLAVVLPAAARAQAARYIYGPGRIPE